MHRVERAELLDEPSGIESFDLSAWIDTGALGFGGYETIDMLLRFYDGTGALLIETPLAKGQVVTRNRYRAASSLAAKSGEKLDSPCSTFAARLD